MSIVVMYEGRRKIAKIASPNTIIQDIIVESAEHFALDHTKCVLKHKRNTIPNSQLFRFSNIPNNAEVDLVLEKSQNLLPCKIAISIQDGLSVTKSLICDKTLQAVLELLVNEGSIASSVLESNPELIYMRNSYSGESLKTTTLQSLGLAGQSGRFMLKFALDKMGSSSSSTPVVNNSTTIPAVPVSDVVSPVTELTPSSGTSSSQNQISTANMSTTNIDTSDMVIESIPTDAAVVVTVGNNVSTSDDSVNIDSQTSMIIDNESTTTTINTTVIDTNNVPSSKPIDPITPPTDINISNSHASTADEITTAIPQGQLLLQLDPAVCLDNIITNNFDRVTIPGIITIAKYMNNIIEHPYESKYRSINMNNKVFQTNVSVIKGVLEYLLSLGFLLDRVNSSLTFPFDTDDDDKGNSLTTDNNSNNNSINNATTSNKKMRKLIRCRKDLQKVMIEKLNIPEDSLPKSPTPPSAAMSGGCGSGYSSSSSSQQQQSQVVFDPYKASIVRQAPQPNRVEASSTDRKLDALHKKRAELEGPVDGVARLTDVIFPLKDGTMKSLQQYSDDNININNNNSDIGSFSSSSSSSASSAVAMNTTSSFSSSSSSVSDNKLINQSIANVLKKASQQEDAPLTTAAVKELKLLEKARVYTRLLIRIRFPDKVCLLGYFHPRHTMVDIYTWVTDCLSTEFKSNSINNSGDSQVSQQSSSSSSFSSLVNSKKQKQQNQSSSPLYCFELYQSPPRRVLAYNNTKDDLIALQLAPAAVINLSWLTNNSGNNSISSSSSSSSTQEQGSYLSQELLLLSLQTADSSTGVTTAFPVGQNLIPTNITATTASSSTSDTTTSCSSSTGTSTAEGKTNGEDNKSSLSSFKPKWFKIGKS